MCVPANICTCDTGAPKTGTACTKHGAAMCQKCNAGFTINADKTKCDGMCVTLSLTHKPTHKPIHVVSHQVSHLHVCMSFVCACVSLDVNECATNSGGCDSKRKCINTVGSMKCGDCATGYLNDGAKGCKGLCTLLSSCPRLHLPLTRAFTHTHTHTHTHTRARAHIPDMTPCSALPAGDFVVLPSKVTHIYRHI